MDSQLCPICTVSRGPLSVLEGSTLIVSVQNFWRRIRISRWFWCHFPHEMDCLILLEFSALAFMGFWCLTTRIAVFWRSCFLLLYLCDRGYKVQGYDRFTTSIDVLVILFPALFFICLVAEKVYMVFSPYIRRDWFFVAVFTRVLWGGENKI